MLDPLLHAIPYDQLLIQTINGIVTGMILALVASGLTLIFGIMDVVNFAHGELFMLGAYLGVLILAATGNFWLALVAATVDADVPAAAGLVWAADQDARAINVSLGFPVATEALVAATRYAHQRGSFICAASGNTPPSWA